MTSEIEMNLVNATHGIITYNLHHLTCAHMCVCVCNAYINVYRQEDIGSIVHSV